MLDQGWFYAGLGGFVGAALRHGVGGAVQRWLSYPFPWGTTFVNLLGCLLIGALWGFLLGRDWPYVRLQTFLLTGLLGGFTTYSTFAWDSLALLREGRVSAGLLFMAAHLIGGLLAAAAGYCITRSLS